MYTASPLWLAVAFILFGLVALAWTGTARATNYALCTGLNKYSSSYMSGNDLTGCVPDAKNVYTNITLRGEWTSSNAKLFTNSQGTFAAVSNHVSGERRRYSSGLSDGIPPHALSIIFA